MGHSAPVLARPHDCISCELCAAVCPTDAIAMSDQWVE
jgi:formate hydrogenlyase subunit 6/NADH:ubiquinone oxidoreductase subunit I